jgi:hypothetical protein
VAVAERGAIVHARHVAARSEGELGWPMGVEPITCGTTIRCSAG